MDKTAVFFDTILKSQFRHYHVCFKTKLERREGRSCFYAILWQRTNAGAGFYLFCLMPNA
jgi:hypothetical protein